MTIPNCKASRCHPSAAPVLYSVTSACVNSVVEIAKALPPQSRTGARNSGNGGAAPSVLVVKSYWAPKLMVRRFAVNSR